jgi:hypothetical protein
MPVLTETVHHASGTFTKGDVLPVDHPLVVDGPHLFEPFNVVSEAEAIRARLAEPVKRGPGRPRKDA